MRRPALALLLSLAALAGARAQDAGAPARWGADDVRRIFGEWLAAAGEDPGRAAGIGPLDPRLTLAPCESHEIARRSAASSSYVIRCTAPEAWEQVVQMQGARMAARPLTTAATPEPQAARLAAPRTPLVVKGENITLVVSGNGFEIASPGKAEQDGFEGDLITVRNTRTGAAMKGRVEQGKIVSVLKL